MRLDQPSSNYVPTPQPASGHSLIWRQHQLIVQPVSSGVAIMFPPLQNHWLLVECLRRSPIKLVKLDLSCNQATLLSWAEACHQANKPVFLRLRSLPDLPAKRYPLYWMFKRVVDWLMTISLLIALAPLLLLLALLVRLSSPGPVLVRNWCVGERGRLFQMFQFRTTYSTSLDRTAVGRWLHYFNLDQLPQLLNVLRGEMSLIGPHPWSIDSALNIPGEVQHRLNALPGVTGVYLSKWRSRWADLRELNQRDLKYLHDWSLVKDFQCLLLTIPRVFGWFLA